MRLHPPSDVTSVNDPAGTASETYIMIRRALRAHANLYGYVTQNTTGYDCIVMKWVTSTRKQPSILRSWTARPEPNRISTCAVTVRRVKTWLKVSANCPSTSCRGLAHTLRQPGEWTGWVIRNNELLQEREDQDEHRGLNWPRAQISTASHER